MRNKKSLLLIAAMAIFVAVCGSSWADSVIGVNFCDRWATPHMAGKTFDGLSNWTDSFPIDDASGTQANGTGLVILGTDGLVTCDWTSPNTWAAGQEGNVNQQLYRVYLDDGGAGARVTIKGLNAWMTENGLIGYTIRVYHSTDTTTITRFIPVDILVNDNVIATAQESNLWKTDGGSRAFVDFGQLSADTIKIAPQAKISGTRATIAGVKITGILSPSTAINPNPAIGVEVPVDQVLSWQQQPEAAGKGVTYRVYFGSDPNTWDAVSVKTTTTESTDFFFDPTPDMANITKYFWRVDAVEPNLPAAPYIRKGPKWWFTTQPLTARIEKSPAGQTVPLGATEAKLVVETLNATAYQWYYQKNLVDTPVALVANSARYTGQTSATLTILDVQVNDEGWYYCVVDNSLHQPATSAKAQLVTQRLVGWWKLDGNLTDSVKTIHADAVSFNGASVDPNFVGIGKDGAALDLLGDLDGFVVMTGSSDFYNFFPRGYSLSAWVKCPERTTDAWGAYIAKQSPDRGFILTSGGDGQAIHTLRNSWNDLASGVEVDDDAWHLVTGTYDALTKTGKVFVDGLERAQTVNTNIPGTSTADVIFGGERLDPANLVAFIGKLDDVRIYSYPIDPVTVAKLYIEFNPDAEVCVSFPVHDIAGPNGEGDEFRDCIVNLYDVMPFVLDWLNCNIVPTCIK